MAPPAVNDQLLRCVFLGVKSDVDLSRPNMNLCLAIVLAGCVSLFNEPLEHWLPHL